MAMFISQGGQVSQVEQLKKPWIVIVHYLILLWNVTSHFFSRAFCHKLTKLKCCHFQLLQGAMQVQLLNWKLQSY